MSSVLDPLLAILRVDGSTPWKNYEAPEKITAKTKLPPPPSELETVLKNFVTLSSGGAVLGALAGAAAMLASAPAGGVVITAAAGATLGGIFGVLEGVFLSGRDARRHSEAVAERRKLRALSGPVPKQ